MPADLLDPEADQGLRQASAPAHHGPLPADHTLNPNFGRQVHQHITAPYLLITDTADEGITHYHAVDSLLSSRTLRHWWAVDNEVSAC